MWWNRFQFPLPLRVYRSLKVSLSMHTFKSVYRLENFQNDSITDSMKRSYVYQTNLKVIVPLTEQNFASKKFAPFFQQLPF